MSRHKLAGIIIACTIAIIVVIVLANHFNQNQHQQQQPARYSLNASVSPSGAGSVSLSPPGDEYEYGENVTLTASPASDYKFDCWSGDASGTEQVITVTMDSTKNIVADFVSNVVNPPVQVALDFFGIKDTHQSLVAFTLNKVQLSVVVDDGKTVRSYSYPSNGEGIPTKYFQLGDLGHQMIFDTSSVGDYLRVSVLAYSCADKETTLSIARALAVFEPSMDTLADLYEMLPETKELIGSYEHTWLSGEEWGTEQGEYDAEGTGDLRLWFRIWSDTEPAHIPKPVFVPDVRISDVKLPTDARPGFTRYPITLSLVNNEEFDVPIIWEAENSIKGDFDQGQATVPKNGKQLDVTKDYYWQAGERTITYTIYYYWNNAKLDTWSGSLNVTP